MLAMALYDSPQVTEPRSLPFFALGRVTSMSIKRYRFAYVKMRDWGVGPVRASLLAVRFSVVGDTGRFLSHQGWRKSRIRVARY